MSPFLYQDIDDKEFIVEMNKLLKECIFYSFVIVVNFLILGNIFNICICLRKKLRQEMLGFYNILISVFNILALVLSYVNHFPQSLNVQYEIVSASNVTCALFSYLGRVTVQMSSWLHVFISFDRFICVITFYERFKRILGNRIKVSFILLNVFAFIALINVPNAFFRLKTRNETKDTICSAPNSTIILIRNLEIGIFRVLLPLTLQIILSFLLIKKLFAIKRRVNPLGEMEREHKFTKIIVYLNVSNFLTEAPILVMSAYFGIIGGTAHYPIDLSVSKSFAKATLAYYISDLLGGYMFGLLFFVNVATNRLFQDQIKCIFGIGQGNDESRNKKNMNMKSEISESDPC